MKFQQFTSALMAKGLEDTSFYRFHRLVSLNEVGGNPVRFGVSVEQFHSANQERNKNWPHTMLATSTHDTKRSEDVRARIDVLSEVPSVWRRSARRWRDCNASYKTQVDGVQCPSLNDEYLFYQTLVGAWPQGEKNASPEFCNRMREYMLKAVREAKEKTSWANPNAEYERAVTSFVEAVLGASGNAQFLADFIPFQQRVAKFGMINSLSQTLLKLTVPGLPDIYQGTELWDFSLVDPDNRRKVDYEERRLSLQRLRDQGCDCPEKALALARQVAHNMHDGSIELFLIWKALQFRKRHRSLFDEGNYVPLKTQGLFSQHVITFARQYHDNALIVIVPRLCARIASDQDTWPLDAGLWKDTRVEVLTVESAKSFTNVFTGELNRPDETGCLNLSEVMANFPLALLAGKVDHTTPQPEDNC
jgi:(1->4)-alpha-D-glucan 1-alpha-D-glucosylmutase